jgi:hypothetical protein
MVNFNETIKDLLSGLSPRQKDIIEQRFGLSGKKRTLAAIGKRYGLTRERVRQIESAALKSINEKLGKKQITGRIVEDAVNHLKKSGGVMKEDVFLNELRGVFKNKFITREQLRFIFEAANVPNYQIEDNNFYGFWYLDKDSRRAAFDFINKLEKFISDKKEELITHKKFDELFLQAIKPHNLKDFVALNYVAISKRFSVSPFGDFGLTRWEEITPKTARAKAYLILKKHGAPLHFREITKRANDFRLNFNKRRIIHQTIHNELIKDPRFVLVGRGMYGLSESGLKPGVAKNVIARILKSKGPLNKEEVVDLVKQERFLKDNTILLNLQNKKHFKRLADGRYCVIK